MPCLRELKASHNLLTTGIDLRSNLALESLHLDHNPIQVVEGLEGLHNLQCLDLSHTPMKTVSNLRPLSLNTKLEVVNLEGTILAEAIPLLRVQLRNLLPGVKLLSGDHSKPSACEHWESPTHLRYSSRDDTTVC